MDHGRQKKEKEKLDKRKKQKIYQKLGYFLTNIKYSKPSQAYSSGIERIRKHERRSCMRKLKPLVWLGVIILFVSMFAVGACSSKPKTNSNGVITAEQWKDTYPDVYSSYQKNKENSEYGSYLKDFPFLETIYDGSGFAKSYNHARAHSYTLTDLDATGRPHVLANCLTCKTPELTAMVNSKGVSVYSEEYATVVAKITEPVSCYNCHENTGDQLVVTAQFLKNALGSDISKVSAKTLACAQCHNEYYFDSETKATTLPWSGLDNMNPDAYLKYYNDIEFVDFTNTISGAKMIKVQHPEFETITGAGNKLSNMQPMGIEGCSSCHMGATKNDSGEAYTSHFWQSPLNNEELLSSKCNTCHKDVKKHVEAIQKDTISRLNTIGKKYETLHKEIGKAAAAGKSDADLAKVRSLVRDGQFYYDFCFVENSNGAHNSVMTKSLLDKAEKYVDEALALLK